MNLTLPDYKNERPEQNTLWDKKYLLFLSGITAVFDGFKALDLEHIGIMHNELRVVIGPNGAGKSTMCDIITGKTRPTTGAVWYDGEEITQKREDEIVRMGIGRKFQTPTVYDSLSVYENMELSLPGSKGVFSALFAQEKKVERDRIMSLLERVRLADVATAEARSLSHGQRQWLAISSLILSQPRLLLVDEPAAGLTDSETELTGELLLELKKDHTLIVIEHDMDFVRQLDSRVTVLCEGRSMAEGMLADVKKNPEVIEAYLGR
ncbi:MAG: urea ABC transporter ATP-binding protein UrtD [Pontiella sp.]